MCVVNSTGKETGYEITPLHITLLLFLFCLFHPVLVSESGTCCVTPLLFCTNREPDTSKLLVLSSSTMRGSELQSETDLPCCVFFFFFHFSCSVFAFGLTLGTWIFDFSLHFYLICFPLLSFIGCAFL